MNILQIVSRLDNSDEARDVIGSTRFLTLNGHKVVVSSEKSGRVKEIDQLGARHYALALRRNIFLMPVCVYRLSRIILKENIQIVHSRDALSSFAGFFASRLTERLFIATIYGGYKKGILGRSELWGKAAIVFGGGMKHYFVRKGLIPQNKIHVIPPFVEVGKPGGGGYQDAASDNKTSPRAKDSFTIGALLPLSSTETAQNFIKTVSGLSRTVHKIKVLIMNKGSKSYVIEKDCVERLKLLIKRHSLGNVVSLLSQDAGEAPILEGFDLFIEAGREDGEDPTRRFLEARARGIPAVTSGLEKNEDYKRLASLVLDLYRNRPLRERIAEEGIRLVREKHDIKKIMQATLNLYEDCISGRNILIMKIGAVGDGILAVPSVRAIRKKFPKAKIKLLAGMHTREIFINSPIVDEVIVCDFKERDKGIRGLLRIAGKLRAENFDIVVDLQNNKKSHILSFLSCAPKRYGYDNGKLSFLLNRKAKDIKTPMDPREHQAKVLGLLDIYNIDKKLELWPSSEDEAWADNFLRSHWVKNDAKLIAINIGSSPRWITKLWPAEYFAEVCNKLALEFGVRILLVGLEKTNPRIEKFLKLAKCKPINALARTNIPKLAALIKRSSLLLSSDSAPVHVAAGVGTPYVALFGPTDPKRHLAPTEKHAVIRKDLKCSPCYNTQCARGYVCMRSVKPDEVYEAIVTLLKLKIKT